eukprot:6186512-Pleurochrysis_carterae.AAC.2
MDSVMALGSGGYSAPEASPPPRTTAPPVAANGPSAADGIPFSDESASCPSRSSIKAESATMIAAPPSARRAHSSSEVDGATAGEESTSSNESGRLVSASGCLQACREARTGTMASCSRVTYPREI